jgi:hypothetical protein
VVAGLVLGLLLTFVPPVAAQETNVIASAENAAMDYWRAVALLGQPSTPQDLKTLSHIVDDIPGFPPAIFEVWPSTGRWLLNEQPALQAMQEGSRKPLCDFGVRTPGRLGLNLQHLLPLRRLTDRALAAARAYEYADNLRGTASIYVSLLCLAQQLDQDQAIESGVFAAELVQRILDGLIGFTSREPPAEDITILTTYLAGARRPVFRLDQYLRTSAKQHADWLLMDIGKAEARLGALYGDVPYKPAVEQLMTLSPEAKTERLELWVEGYRAHMLALAEACAKPYRVGLYPILDLDKEKEAALKARGKAENPLIPLLVPSMEKAYERFLLAEANFTMADILCAAALYRADLDAWPPDLEALSKFIARDFERDPFSGAQVQYKLKSRMPILGIRAPRWLAKQPQSVFRATLVSRRQDDMSKVAELKKQMASEARKNKIRELQEDAVPVNK